MITYTEADVEMLAEVLNAARDAGVHHGNYTLARWVLDRWPVEESTPIASPPPAGLNVHTADVPDDTIIVGDFGEFARAAREGRSVNPKAFAAIKNVAAPAGEVVSVPPPAPAAVDEPAPVPPPVDALLKLVDEFGEDMADSGMADGTGARETGTQCMLDAQQARDKIVTALSALWAAGVEEGRRQRDAEIHTNVLRSARLVAAEAGFGPAPESVTVSYERRASAYEQGIYDAGVAEGRRQAREERTDAVQILTFLDTEEGRLHLRKLIRTGEIVLPHG